MLSQDVDSGWFLPEEHVFQDHARFVNELVKAGGNAGIGSHGQLTGVGLSLGTLERGIRWNVESRCA